MESIPDKLYFKIGEVAKIVGVKPYVLRYWEKEFSMIRPGKSESKHRLYRRRDVETLLEIKRLLHAERFTIDGAKKRLRTHSKAPAAPPPVNPPAAPPAAPPVAERHGQMLLPLGERVYRKALIELKREVEALYAILQAESGCDADG